MLLTIRDETTSGSLTNELTLDLLDETITVRELIRSRVYQEVDEHNRRVRQANAATAAPYNGLVTPTATATEHQPSGPRAPVPGTAAREIDWRKQFDAACDAFGRNGFFILVDDRQAEALDETITLRAGQPVTFVKLTPLVGG
jgi:hypothetical protein